MASMVEVMARQARAAQLQTRASNANVTKAKAKPKRSQYRRQRAHAGGKCPACKRPLTAVSTSVVLTFYQCKNQVCPNKAIIAIPRPLKREKHAAIVDALREERIAEQSEIDIEGLGPIGAQQPPEFYPGSREPRGPSQPRHRRPVTESD